MQSRITQRSYATLERTLANRTTLRLAPSFRRHVTRWELLRRELSSAWSALAVCRSYLGIYDTNPRLRGGRGARRRLSLALSQHRAMCPQSEFDQPSVPGSKRSQRRSDGLPHSGFVTAGGSRRQSHRWTKISFEVHRFPLFIDLYWPKLPHYTSARNCFGHELVVRYSRHEINPSAHDHVRICTRETVMKAP